MRSNVLCAVLLFASSVAIADSKVAVSPAKARPGDAVLVTVTGAKEVPKGTAGGKDLHFFRAKAGYQALFAVPLDAKPEAIPVEIRDAKPTAVAVRAVTFPEAKVVVEEEFANPPAAERKTIDADNEAIVGAMTKGKGDPQFTRGFRRPTGAVTSSFGEWRTFNDGHRSQHLGIDYAAREGTKVRAINNGTVELVRDTFLGGNVVVVAHGAGIASAYFHLSATDVKEGALLKAGDVIGRAGKTGRATGSHVHLAVRVPGGLVNPASFLTLRIAPAPVAKTAAAVR